MVPRRRRRTESLRFVIAALAAIATVLAGSAALARARAGGMSAVAPAAAGAAPTLPAETIVAAVNVRNVFFGGRRARLSYAIGGSEPADVRVELVRAGDGAVVRRWAVGVIAPGATRTLRWDGMAGGMVERYGTYEFRITATGESGASTTYGGPERPRALEAPGAWASLLRAGATRAPGAFRFLRHRFPVAGAHRYGEGAARFGGGRGHQGQDVFADCGTPIVAARGGVVKFKRFESAAGNYVVIDGGRTGRDYVYMHMRGPARVDEGDRVRTGQVLGLVGATGRADGCHLHFEEWTAPGWYSGGSAVDPLPDLRGWDAQLRRTSTDG
jgi:murein DD-endopeptidase MepM/ murein hydrolase activator NlpD